MLLQLSCIAAHAQSSVKFGREKINILDKQERKQGDWIFVDSSGMPVLSCTFTDDMVTGPEIFYRNGDTAFVKFIRKENTQTFIAYAGGKKYTGDYIFTSDSTRRIETDDDLSELPDVTAQIRKYGNIGFRPVYYFAQKKMIDYTASGFSSTNISFNKPLYVELTISTSGTITDVKFPKENNILSAREESELRWIYMNMPRWQPAFVDSKPVTAVVVIRNNNIITTN